MAKIETRKAGGLDGLPVRKAAESAAVREFKSTGGNDVSGKHLAKSSNASLGIDSDTANGISNAAGTPSAGGNTNVGSKQKNASLDDNYGGQDYSARMGTQGSREDMTIGPKANRGEFGVSSASGGWKEGNADTYGPGARKKGTAAMETGIPGRSGSMARAFEGLRSAEGGSQASQNPGENSKSMAKSRAGMKGGGGKS